MRVITGRFGAPRPGGFSPVIPFFHGVPYIEHRRGIPRTHVCPIKGKIMATKKAAKKAAPKSAKPAANKPIKNVLGKSGLVDYIATTSEMMAKDVRAVLAGPEGAVIGSVNKNGARTFILPGLLKITVASIPAKPKRKGINPFTKQEQWFAAKPATVKVKVRPLKKLKDAAAK